MHESKSGKIVGKVLFMIYLIIGSSITMAFGEVLEIVVPEVYVKMNLAFAMISISGFIMLVIFLVLAVKSYQKEK